MYTTQIMWNFKTTSTAYLVKLEDRISLQDSRPNCTLSSLMVFFNNSGNVTAVNQTSMSMMRIKCVLRGSVPGILVYIMAMRKVSHSRKFSDLSHHLCLLDRATL